jgi:hypothetical protein
MSVEAVMRTIIACGSGSQVLTDKLVQED